MAWVCLKGTGVEGAKEPVAKIREMFCSLHSVGFYLRV